MAVTMFIRVRQCRHYRVLGTPKSVLTSAWSALPARVVVIPGQLVSAVAVYLAWSLLQGRLVARAVRSARHVVLDTRNTYNIQFAKFQCPEKS